MAFPILCVLGILLAHCCDCVETPRLIADSRILLHTGVAGFLTGFGIELTTYAHDSKKLLRQSNQAVPALRFTNPVALYRSVAPYYRGLIPVLFTGTAPAFGLFFGGYTLSKYYFTSFFHAFNEKQNLNLSVSALETLITLSCSLFAAPLASFAAVPSDVLKKRMILMQPHQSFTASVRTIIEQSGVAGLFRGAKMSLLKDLPVAIIKMMTFELFCTFAYLNRGADWYPRRMFSVAEDAPTVTMSELGARRTSTLMTMGENALCGFVSAVLTSIVTMPLDVLNTHIKDPRNTMIGPNVSIRASLMELYRAGGVPRLFRGTLLRTATFSFSATAFWIGQLALQNSLRKHWL